MSDGATVYAECLRLEVRVTLGLPSDVSNLEQFVLRAIHAGATTVPLLGTVLGVSPKILVDCLGDLWRQGHVLLDVEDPSEPVSLSPAIEELVSSGSLDALASSYRTTETRTVLLDTLTGRVLPESARQAPRVPRLRVPRRHSDYERRDVTSQALVRALTEDSRQRSSHDGGGGSTARAAALRVLTAYLTPEFVNLAQGTRTVPLAVVVRANDARGLTIEAADPTLTESERATATRRLQELVDEQPDSSFVAALRENLSLAPAVEVPPVATVVAQLQTKCDSLSETVPGTRQSAHDRIARDLGLARSRIALARRQAARLRVVVGEEHVAEVERLVESAQTQVVIATPRIGERVLNRLMPRLERAVARGVQIVILWGLGTDDQLPGPVRNALDNLQRGAGPEKRVLVKTQVSARLHAKVVVVDNQRCLVTSCNFLNDGGLRELGLVVERDGNDPCGLAEELLGWTYQTFPDHDIARAILRGASSFDTVEQAAPEPLALPSFTPMLEKAPAGAELAALWSMGWRRAADEVAREAAGLAPTAVLVRDAEHPRLLLRAIDTATWRLVVASDQLSATVLDADLRARLRAAVARGVHVTLVHGRFALQDPGAAEEAVSTLQREVLAEASGTGSLVVRHIRSHHAKGVVVDDEAVVGSFNWLSFPGHYNGRGRWRDRGEVSVLVNDPEVCDQVAAAWGSARAARPIARRPERGGPAPVLESEHLRKAIEVMEVLTSGGDDVGAGLLTLLPLGDEETPVLDALVASGAQEHDLARVAAAMLCQGPVTTANPWWRWLVEHQWRAGDIEAAAAMRPMVEDPAFRPREPLTMATSAWLAGGSGAVLIEQVLRDDLTADEQQALCLLGIADLFAHGEHATREALDVLRPPDGPIAEAWRIATELYDTTGRPLPVAELAEIARQRRGEVASHEHWEALQNALERMRSHNTGFISGAATIKQAFRRGEVLFRLQEVAERHDAEALGSWLAELDPEEAGELVNVLSARAGAKPIIGSRREPFVLRMQAVLGAARLARDRTAPPDRDIEVREPRVIRAVSAFARVKADLTVAAESVAEPERVLAVSAVRRATQMMGEADS